MSLNKRIESGKEHRKPYRGSKNFDYSCRNHGGCPWCEGNRLHNDRVKREKFEEELKQYKIWKNCITIESTKSSM